MRFIPSNEMDKKEMLKAVGVKEISDLFADIPKNALLEKQLSISKALGERQLRNEIEAMAAKNKSAKQLNLFLGGGCYNHFVPATVPAIISRSEFYTAYTPYQAELSQGLLQAQYEWQTYACLLTGMDLANASMYDGASATAEAMIMAKNATGRKRILVSKGLNPEYKQVVATYAKANGLQLREVELNELGTSVDEQTACFIVQQPSFFGCIENLSKIEKAVHEKGCLLVVAVAEALSLAFLPKLAEANVDIVAAEVQSFGNTMSFGGPHAGVIACRQRFLRQVPGRIVGKTVDAAGNEGFVLTLQTREQHIRRARASSNICSNQALCALAATVYLATLGENGLRELAEENHRNATYLAGKLEKLGFRFPFGKSFFNEFVVKRKGMKLLQEKLLGKGIVFGLGLEQAFPELKDCALVAATEMNAREEIDKLIEQIGALL